MSSAANHRKRSHRSQRMHVQASAARQWRSAGKQNVKHQPGIGRGWMRKLFRVFGKHERDAEGDRIAAALAEPRNDMRKEASEA